MDRQLTIEACIVKVMKFNKKMDHNQLLEEVVNKITLFKAQPQLFKEAIEKLINNEYIKRDGSQHNTYLYQS